MAQRSSILWRRALIPIAFVLLVASCGDDGDAGEQDWINPRTAPVDSTSASVVIAPTSAADVNDDVTTDMTTDGKADVSAPPSVDPMVSAPPPSADSTTTSSTTSSTTTTTTIDPAGVDHAFPVDPDVTASFTPQAHANYQATDIFASAGCGTRLLAPVTGVVDEVLENTYDPAVDDPATRGGNAVSIVGDDGVRYYLAHFQLIDPAIVAGARVTAGDTLGEMGDTGRAGACHMHFGLSLDCVGTGNDWWVRRGVIWPDEYLDSWRNGENLSPRPALEEWFTEYPDACRSVEDTPYPVS